MLHCAWYSWKGKFQCRLEGATLNMISWSFLFWCRNDSLMMLGYGVRNYAIIKYGMLSEKNTTVLCMDVP
jgi:hypothetical protein